MNATQLRRGWTTGACATAAAKAAYAALLGGAFPESVEIVLPSGLSTTFGLSVTQRADGCASAGVVKDAGDDPDVTHGALVLASVRHGQPGTGVSFRAGTGVGTVTKPGLPVAVGEPAINPVPRRMIAHAISQAADAFGGSGDALVEIAIENGAALARRTLNPRLGIIGGLSVLGTTGVVIPYSCSAWIAGIREGIDVAHALGIRHVAGATGRTSEEAVAAHHALTEDALIDMGDFAGAMLACIRQKPFERVTIAGGFAKMCKLAQGALDLHSARSTVNLEMLAQLAAENGATESAQRAIASANTALEALRAAQSDGIPLARAVAIGARQTAMRALDDVRVAVDTIVVDRDGHVIGCAP